MSFALWRRNTALDTGIDPISGLPADQIFGDNVQQTDTRDPLQDITENKNLLIQLLIVKLFSNLSKTPEGLKVLQKLGSDAINGIFKTTHALAQSSCGSSLTSWSNPMLISGIFERFGLLPPAFNAGFHDGISKLTGVNIFGDIIGDIFGKGGMFPSVMSYSGYTYEGPKR